MPSVRLAPTMTKSLPTFFLKAVVVLLGLVVLLFCLFVLPLGIRTTPPSNPYYPILIGMYLPTLPFFFALYYSLTLLTLIERQQIFTAPAVVALSRLKLAAATLGGLYALGLPYIFFVADQDDAPGVFLLGLIFTFGPLLVSVLAANLKHLIQPATTLKTDNDLTV